MFLSKPGQTLLTAVVFVSLLRAQTTPPKATFSAAFRLLQQSTWGPTTQTIAQVQQLGIPEFVEQQFSAPLSSLPDVPPDDAGRSALGPMQQQFFINAQTGTDQLRQRVAFALGQIWVVSGARLGDAKQMLPYLRLLQNDAFANYRTIMYDVTLSPAMGRYLDMVNNDKPNPARGTGADENYARELLQLFTIGVRQLQPDGSPLMSYSGTLPTYTQEQVEGFARVFTGWTYAPLPGAVPRAHNPANWNAPMVAWEANHDTTAKKVLNGTILPAGQSAAKDLSDALDNIFQSSNLPPFVCRQMIQHLVTSSPSPAYIARVTQMFIDNGAGVRGDMKAVVRAILLDPEARRGDAGSAAPEDGHLSEPVLFITSVLRALNAQVVLPNSLPGSGSAQGENVYLPPSVFNYFSPGYRIEGSSINAPEFQILSPSTAMTRADFVNSIVYGRINGVTVDLTPWTQLAADTGRLLDGVSAAFFAGRMPDPVRQSISRAVAAATSAATKAQAAIYLAATSGAYQVQH